MYMGQVQAVNYVHVFGILILDLDQYGICVESLASLLCTYRGILSLVAGLRNVSLCTIGAASVGWSRVLLVTVLFLV